MSLVPGIQTVVTALAAYAAYSCIFWRVLIRAEAKACRVGPQWLGLLAHRVFSGFSHLVGVRLASEGGEGLAEVSAEKRYLIVWHPHGFLAWSAMFFLGRKAVMGEPHGREWFAVVAPALFRLPIVGEGLMLMNGRQVDRRTVEGLLSRGASIAIQPGGVREQLLTRQDQEQVVFPARLGFIRQAIRHGVDALLPCYVFNETQLYRRMPGFDGLSEWIHRRTGFGLPFVTARFGLPMAGLLPLPTDVHVRWGRPVAVGPQELEPSEERVEELFGRYLAELRSTFERHAAECLAPELAARGLKVIRLGAQGQAS
mmetsp:Transcript_34397/g.109201  ORF Transcript_34397/g.109201 Transcript_34397/m.109201 type:complete len:313 (-) Transcript_34397:167-1105(-)